jgi:hypothetical protein
MAAKTLRVLDRPHPITELATPFQQRPITGQTRIDAKRSNSGVRCWVNSRRCVRALVWIQVGGWGVGRSLSGQHLRMRQPVIGPGSHAMPMCSQYPSLLDERQGVDSHRRNGSVDASWSWYRQLGWAIPSSNQGVQHHLHCRIATHPAGYAWLPAETCVIPVMGRAAFTFRSVS